jgi:hypothetical protein
MKIHLYRIVCLLLSTAPCMAQSTLSPSVIASEGNHFSNSSFQLSYTIGEMALVSTEAVGNTILTQGFHQPDKFTIILVNDLANDLNAVVFPNPFGDQVYLQLEGWKHERFMIDLFDASGRKVINGKQFQHIPGTQQIPIETSHLAVGTYLLRLLNTETGSEKSFRITRMHY